MATGSDLAGPCRWRAPGAPQARRPILPPCATTRRVRPFRNGRYAVNGAESLVHTLLGCGVEVCFANPGTSEMHFVAALDRIPGMRCVLGLQENVVTGMADGYWRMTEKPAATLLHCGPGLANGLANLHNARRAALGHRELRRRPGDLPPHLRRAADRRYGRLRARRLGLGAHLAPRPTDVGADAAAAVQAALTSPGQIAT